MKSELTSTDLIRLNTILLDRHVCKFMPGKFKDLAEISHWVLHDNVWLIHNTKQEIIGFVQIYDLSKLHAKALGEKSAFEISFALPPKLRERSGMVVEKVKQALDEFRQTHSQNIYAFTDPENIASQKVLENSGFALIHKMKYHGNSKYADLVYKAN